MFLLLVAAVAVVVVVVVVSISSGSSLHSDTEVYAIETTAATHGVYSIMLSASSYRVCLVERNLLAEIRGK